MTRLLVVTDDFPLPVNSGGRTDIWRRMRALRAEGARLAMLSWVDVPRDGWPGDDIRADAAEVLDALELMPITRSPAEIMRRLAHLGRLPSHAAGRWVTLDRARVLRWARGFAPDVIVLDRLFAVAPVRWLADALGVPWVYRAHNREAAYMAGLARQAQAWRLRAGLQLNQLGLARLERDALRDAALVFDISADDARHWQQAGFGDADRLRWLPPVVDADFVRAVAARAVHPPDWDILYFGNLNTPNNLEALDWLTGDVLPRLPDAGLRIAVAGSRPAALARTLAARDARITLLADPPAMGPLVGAARVLVNPMRSGSGVNLKTLDMLAAAAHRVCTSVGAGGLPPGVRADLQVHDDAAGFAGAVARALQSPQRGRPSDALAALQPGPMARAMLAAVEGVRRRPAPSGMHRHA